MLAQVSSRSASRAAVLARLLAIVALLANHAGACHRSLLWRGGVNRHCLDEMYAALRFMPPDDARHIPAPP